MNFAKRMLALMLAVMMVFALTGCSDTLADDTDVVATYDDLSMNGILYTRFLLDAYTLADTYKDDPAADVLDTTVEGIPAAEWIQNTAYADVERYFTCLEKFEKSDMEFTDEDQAYVDDYAANMLEQYSFLYGPFGIDLQSLKDYYSYNIKSMALFDYYYGKGGEKEVPEEEIKAKLADTYNLTKVMIFDKALPTADADGNLVEPSAEEVAAAEAKARSYYDRAVAGEDFEQLIIEWESDLFAGQDIGHTHEEEGSHDLITQIGGSSVPVAYSSVMDAAPFGEPQFIEDSDVYYVATRYDIAEDQVQLESYRSTILLTLRSEDFRVMTEEWMQEVDVTFNDAVIEKYSPEWIAKAMNKLGLTNNMAQ